MKKLYWLLLPAALLLTFSLGIQSCRKINEATELGNGLVPAVDNINTFETFLDVETDNGRWNGNTTVSPNDAMALGAITNDPEFGATKADIYFQYGPATYGPAYYQFYHQDSVVGVDSVVLSLAYVDKYGDSTMPLTVHVQEVDQTADFKDSALYTTQNADFATGPTLGSKTFSLSQLKDTQLLIRKRDTLKVANVLRIPLTNFAAFANALIVDSTTAHYGTFTSFYNKHHGLAVKADMAGNGLGYFNLLDSAKSKVQVYFRVKRNGVIDTTSAAFYHGLFGAGYSATYSSGDTSTLKARATQANIIRRTPANNWLTYLSNLGASEDKAYVQTEPGSAIYLRIPGLDTMTNKLVHRAELVASIVPSASSDVFTPPAAMYLGRRSGDSMLQIRDDSLSALLGSSGAVSSIFGGSLKTDNTYRFNMSLYVQQVLLHNVSNDQLKLFAPYKVRVADARFPRAGRSIYGISRIAQGRAVLGGGTFADPSKRMRLRIVYSRLP
ncbi:MAG: DUF4270 family protein [Chitinophagaceae bacterium]|nr:MAG: DUF4270 family protein [Chitinophagaceae bacterium]